MFVLGVDIGYSSVKTVLIDENNQIKKKQYEIHHGKIDEHLKNQFFKIQEQFDLSEIKYMAVTGSGSNYLVERLGIQRINEVTALVEAVCSLGDAFGSIVEIGGESAKFISDFSKVDKSGIKISINSNCAAGTGSFIEEQVNRLNINLDDYAEIASTAYNIPRIAGRCSVFAKTDIIHHQQEGIPTAEILKGLSYSLARNYKSAVVGRTIIKQPVIFTGGVSKNKSIEEALIDILSLQNETLTVHEKSDCMTTYGCAIMALKKEMTYNPDVFCYWLNNQEEYLKERDTSSIYNSLNQFGVIDYSDKHICNPIDSYSPSLDCYLGVDIGSTSTNVVLINKAKEIVNYLYLRTKGDPKRVVKEALKTFGEKYTDLNVLGVGITGSGRYMIGKEIGADLIVDEITSQARAAVEINPEVDTVFEIGGQDSKYIRIKNGVVVDFQMNKICAAGTGSFIEEQSIKFDIPLETFGEMALKGKCPANLGERCTVFIESSIASYLSKGKDIDDIAAGLCYSIVRNYLDRVVGNHGIGDKIFLQGGIAWNQGIVNAFKAITGKEIIVPEYFSITGAYGAAILSITKTNGIKKSKFKGFFLERREEKEIQNVNTHTNQHNEFSETAQKSLFKNYEGTIDPKKKTVGIPRGLFTYGMYSMFYTFFKSLGFNVILSENTNENTIIKAQEYSLDETCYPLKLMNGHIAQLVEKKADYIFFPDLYSVDHPGSESRQNFGCAYMQLAFKMIRKSMKLDEKNIELLSPTIAFSFGKKFMSKSFISLGQQLNCSDKQIKQALQNGMKAFADFEKRLEIESEKIMEEIEGEEKVFVIVSKIYGAVDPVLNMGIPDKIEKMGYKVLPFYNIPETNINDKYPNMYWPFGQHIIEPAHFIRNSKNMYAILLTHHGCGPDSVLAHYFMNEMGEKPYLHIEVDEHSSKVGVITRLEAFINSLNASRQINEEKLKIDLCQFATNSTCKKREKVYVPPLYPYTELYCTSMKTQGIDAIPIGKITSASIEKGKKFMLAEEYFSTTALLGSVIETIENNRNKDFKSVFLIPRNEGTEVDGQYSDFIKGKVENLSECDIEFSSPFLEDLIYIDDEEKFRLIMEAIILGDIVRLTPWQYRNEIFTTAENLIKERKVDVFHLKELSEIVYHYLLITDFRKSIMVIGDPLLSFNDEMNNHCFSLLEKEQVNVVYTPMSEYLKMFWKDHADFNSKNRDENHIRNISLLNRFIQTVSETMKDKSNFDKDYLRLKELSDNLIGYYSGMNGRYRYAKLHSGDVHVDGIITISSLYENTGIMLNILKNEKILKKPVLNLTFDGNTNENDRMLLSSEN